MKPPPPPSSPPPPSADPFPERLGEFQLLERLGGGGMGVVYLARQESLGRLVALKLIHPEHLYFPGMRERFLREVEASARLQHPAIVPIHTFGEEGGVPYFAMERIEGCTLAEALRTLPDATRIEVLSGADLRRAVVRRTHGSEVPTPTPLEIPLFAGSFVEAVLRIARAVAEALAHAHERGVLHRDVKPSNVMLTPAGRVLLLDFGLATTEGVTKLTRTGALVGSLPYLAPELLAGEAAPTPASDVYSLGVTLYELLARALPFRDGSFETLRDDKLRGAPPPLHERNPAVAWDVETVCLTAMERDPARRYGSALAFAGDLENLLHLRPIGVRRPGPMLRARRWTQRHPAWTVAVALGALLLVGGPLAWLRVQHDAFERLQAEKARTARQAERALANLRRAIDAVQRGIERLDDAALDDMPQIESLRRATFEDALLVYRQFTGEEAEFPELRLEIGRTKSRLADLLRMLGRTDEAEAAWREALATLDALLPARPDEPLLAYDVARCREGLAAIAIERGDAEEAAATATRAITAFDALLAATPDDADFLRHAIHARLVRCVALRRGGRIDDSHAVAAEIVALVAARAAPLAANDDLRFDAARTLQQIAVLQLETRRAEPAADDADAVADLLTRAEALMADPFDATYARGVAQTEAELLLARGDLAAARGDDAAELAAKSGAVERFRELRRRWPEVATYEQELAAALSNLALRHHRAGELAAARPLLEESRTILAGVVERQSELVEPHVRLAATLLNLAVVELDLEALDDALARLDDARAEVDLLAERNPDDPRVGAYLVTIGSYLCEVQLARGDTAAAAAAARELLELAPDDPDNVRRAKQTLETCAEREAAAR